MQHILMFKLGGRETFAIDALKVQEIIKMGELNNFPGSSPLIAGCMNFRGSTVAVVDLPKVLFGIEVQDAMVAILDGASYGLKVSSVTQISKMDILFDDKALFSRRFVDGVFFDSDNSIVQMLSIERIIDHINKKSLAA